MMDTGSDNSPATDDEPSLKLRAVLAGSALVAALSLVGWVALMARRGLDMTDEGFYLNWMSQPDAYPAAVTLFGFVLHPVYDVLGGSIAALRLANVVVTVGLTSLLLWTASHAFGHERDRAFRLRDRVLLALIGGPISFVFLSTWLLTPNYNTLTMQALLVVAAGTCCLYSLGSERRAWIGSVLLGVGGWLAFMAKPTAAIAAAVLVIVTATVVRPGRWRQLVCGLVLAGVLGVAAALRIDGSVGAFVTRLQTGADDAAALESGHSFADAFRFDLIEWSAQTQHDFFLILGAAWAGALLVQARWSSRVASWALSIALLIATLALLTGEIAGERTLASFEPLFLAAVPLGSLLAVFMYRNRDELHPERWRLWVLSAFMLLLPATAAFGTNNNYWLAMGLNGGFWVIGGIALLLALHRGTVRDTRLIMLTLLGSLAVLAFLLHAAAQAPYRQSLPLRGMTEQASVRGSVVYVDDRISPLINSLQRAADNADFQHGTVMIDLTGRSPLLIYALEGRALGAPWLLGGYPGSADLAERVLSREECDALANAWLIDEPGGTRRIDPSTLEEFGIVVAEDYDAVATVPFEGTNILLLRPNRDIADARAACKFQASAQ